MPQTKTNKDRKDKVDRFKEEAKQAAAQANIPKTHLIPQTNWQSTDILELRGDLLEVLEKQMVMTFENLENARVEFSKAAQVMQMIMSANVKAGKINLTYQWNNGENATESEVTDFKTKMEEIQQLRQKQYEDSQKNQNASVTGLVGVGGEPIGTTQNLYEGHDDPSGPQGIAGEAGVEINDEPTDEKS